MARIAKTFKQEMREYNQQQKGFTLNDRIEKIKSICNEWDIGERKAEQCMHLIFDVVHNSPETVKEQS